MLAFHHFPGLPLGPEAALERPSSVGVWLSCLVALVVLLAEGALVYAAYHGQFPVALAWFVHAAIVLGCGVLLVIARLLQVNLTYPVLLWTSVAFLGPIGAFGVVLASVLFVFHRMAALPLTDWVKMLFPLEERTVPKDIYDDLIAAGQPADTSFGLVSYRDIVELGSEGQKREAIAKISRYFQPAFAPALLKATHDESNAIRVQAATAISKIEHHFTEHSVKLEELLQHYPSSPELLKYVAQHYDNYAFTGILDEDREDENREKAIEYYTRYLKLRRQDVDARRSIGRLLLRKGDYAEASDWFARCLEEGIDSPELHSWYMESLYRAGRFGQLRRACVEAASTPEIYGQFPEVLRPVVQLWSGNAAR
jgi:tetratricopeptide (TPR) repeat protein